VTREDMDYLVENCPYLPYLAAVCCVTGCVPAVVYTEFSLSGRETYSKALRNRVASGFPGWVLRYREGMKVLKDRSRS